MRAMGAHTRTVEQRLRWWKGLACGLTVVALLTWALPSSTAQETPGGLERVVQRLLPLDNLLRLLQHLTIAADEAGRLEVVITGANLRIVNGLGTTENHEWAGESDRGL